LPLLILKPSARFFIQLVIQDFAAAIVRKYGSADEQALLFPSNAVAKRCVDFLYKYSVRQTEATSLPGNSTRFRVIDLVLSGNGDAAQGLKPMISAVIYPRSESRVARAFWQHSGDGVSSRRAEFCFKAFDQGYLTARTSGDEAVKSSDRTCKGPRRYQRKNTLSREPTKAKGVSVRTLWSETLDHTVEQDLDGKDLDQFVEERFGRNLNMSLATKAKTAIRRRIAGCLTADAELDDALKVGRTTESARNVKGVSEDDVYLFPAGMNAIFNAHRTLLEARGALKSVSFGYDPSSLVTILANG
jgi:cystathionine gamma-synthase